MPNIAKLPPQSDTAKSLAKSEAHRNVKKKENAKRHELDLNAPFKDGQIHCPFCGSPMTWWRGAPFCPRCGWREGCCD